MRYYKTTHDLTGRQSTYDLINVAEITSARSAASLAGLCREAIQRVGQELYPITDGIIGVE